MAEFSILDAKLSRRINRLLEMLSERLGEVATEGARVVIKRDLENAFERDNTSRQNREKYHALGDDCDRAMWEKVRAAWMREEAKKGTP